MNNYITQLSLRGKFLLIAIAMLIPIGGLSFVAVRAEVAAMNFADLRKTRAWTGPPSSSRSRPTCPNTASTSMAVAAWRGGRTRRTDRNTPDAMHEGRGEARRTREEWQRGVGQGLPPGTNCARGSQRCTGDGRHDVARIETIPGLIADLHLRVQAVSEVSG